MAAVLAGLGARAVATAAAHEEAVTSGRYAGLAARGEVPGLLSGDSGPPPGEAVIVAESPFWDAIGLGAITDFVQQEFGPVDLDRSLVELTVTADPWPGCPACAGRRFNFPADLADSQERMCPEHRKEADAVIRRRLTRAEASNRPGWRMLGDPSGRLELPHLPGGLATRLAAAKEDPVRTAAGRGHGRVRGPPGGLRQRAGGKPRSGGPVPGLAGHAHPRPRPRGPGHRGRHAERGAGRRRRGQARSVCR